MSDYAWSVVENIVVLIAMCFLIWLTDTYWWVLLLLFMNSPTSKK